MADSLRSSLYVPHFTFHPSFWTEILYQPETHCYFRISKSNPFYLFFLRSLFHFQKLCAQPDFTHISKTLKKGSIIESLLDCEQKSPGVITQNARFQELSQAALTKKNEVAKAKSQREREKWAVKAAERRREEENLNRRLREEAAKDAPVAQVELGLFGKLSIEV